VLKNQEIFPEQTVQIEINLDSTILGKVPATCSANGESESVRDELPTQGCIIQLVSPSTVIAA